MQQLSDLIRSSEMAFPLPLMVCPIDDERWVLVSQLIYTPKANAEVKVEVEIPEGFLTDFASIPFYLWSLLPKWSTYGWAAVVHDWLYWMQDDVSVSREQADKILRDAMLALKVPSWKASLIYRAVRWKGGSAWSENARLKGSGVTRIFPIPTRGPALHVPEK